MASKKKKVTSWTLVVILLIFFPLIGFILLIKKLYEDKEGGYKNSIVARILGGISITLGVLMLMAIIVAGPDTSSVMVILIIFIGPGLFLFMKGLSLKNDAVRYEKYIELICHRGVVSIEEIATEVSLTYAKTAKELEGMINVGYLENAYVDHGKMMVILKGKEPNAVAGNRPQQQTSKAFVCKNCGGSNVVASGTTVECEYCGSPISYT
jgi:DNA-directed RNA polymerase subunit RPC12/RpoP